MILPCTKLVINIEVVTHHMLCLEPKNGNQHNGLDHITNTNLIWNFIFIPKLQQYVSLLVLYNVILYTKQVVVDVYIIAMVKYTSSWKINLVCIMLSTPNNDRDLKRFEAITLNTTKKVSRHPINQVWMHKPTKNTVS